MKEKTTSRSLLWTMLVLILLMLLSVIVITTEYTLQALYPDKILIFDSDPATIARFRPGLDRDNYGNSTVHVTTNSFGFRDENDFDPADADILVFGDSNMASMSLDFSDTFGEQLERSLGNRYTAANLGVPGYGPDQSLRGLATIAGRSKARALIFHVFADNDLGDMFRNNIYRMTGSGLQASRDPLSPDPLFTVNRFLLVRGINKVIATAGLPVTLLDLASGDDYYSPNHQGMDVPVLSQDRHAVEAWTAISEAEYRHYKAGRYTSWTADHYDYGIAGAPRSEMATAARELLGGIIVEALKAWQGRDECFLVLAQPSENDLLDRGATVARTELYRNFPQYNPRTLTSIVTDAAGSAGAESINLFDAYADDPASYYFSHEEKPGDNHWNARGIVKAVSLVSDYFTGNDCL